MSVRLVRGWPEVSPAIDLQKRLEGARDLLADQFDQPLKLEDAAREACLSPFHFHRLFVRAYGRTPHEFLTERRIDQAKRLLAAGDLSVTEICFALGYESPGTFSARFHRMVGCTPTEYRLGAAHFFAISRIKAHRFVPTCFVGRGFKTQDRRSTSAETSAIVMAR
jgi:AraC-like DNA-binding protein